MVSPEIVKIAMFLGAGISVSVSSVACGIGEGYIAGEAVHAMMKQPGANDKLFRNMFVGQAIAETGEYSLWLLPCCCYSADWKTAFSAGLPSHRC